MPTTPLCRCRVLYIGSAVPTTTKDGLQGIQEPLKERYPVDHNSDTRGIDSWLSVWSNGMLLEYIDSDKKTEAAFFPIHSLHYCAAVRYVNVSGYSIEGGGERFLPLDSPFANLPDSKDPPIFAAILRRTSGVKVLECHGFICTNAKAANALVRCCFHAYADSMYVKMDENGLDKSPFKNEMKAIKEKLDSSRSSSPEGDRENGYGGDDSQSDREVQRWAAPDRGAGSKPSWQKRQQQGDYETASISSSLAGRYRKRERGPPRAQPRAQSELGGSRGAVVLAGRQGDFRRQQYRRTNSEIDLAGPRPMMGGGGAMMMGPVPQQTMIVPGPRGEPIAVPVGPQMMGPGQPMMGGPMPQEMMMGQPMMNGGPMPAEMMMMGGGQPMMGGPIPQEMMMNGQPMGMGPGQPIMVGPGGQPMPQEIMMGPGGQPIVNGGPMPQEMMMGQPMGQPMMNGGPIPQEMMMGPGRQPVMMGQGPVYMGPERQESMIGGVGGPIIVQPPESTYGTMRRPASQRSFEEPSYMAGGQPMGMSPYMMGPEASYRPGMYPQEQYDAYMDTYSRRGQRDDRHHHGTGTRGRSGKKEHRRDHGGGSTTSSRRSGPPRGLDPQYYYEHNKYESGGIYRRPYLNEKAFSTSIQQQETRMEIRDDGHQSPPGPPRQNGTGPQRLSGSPRPPTPPVDYDVPHTLNGHNGHGPANGTSQREYRTLNEEMNGLRVH